MASAARLGAIVLSAIVFAPLCIACSSASEGNQGAGSTQAAAAGAGGATNSVAGAGGAIGPAGAATATASGGSGAAVTGTAAAGTTSAIGGCVQAQSTADNTLQGADIIFALDSSRSMDAEIGFVQQNMNAFSQQIVASGVDARVIVIADPSTFCIAPPLGSGQCPNDTQLPRYAHIAQTVGSNDALDVFVNTYAQWSQFLRQSTTKTFVVVTDDDATDGPINSATAFTAAVQQLDAGGSLFADWNYSGIFCYTNCPDAAAIGSIHQDLVQLTGGTSGDLCLQDFAPVFDRLATAIVSRSQIACEWAIPPAPAGQTLDFGSVNVRITDAAGITTSLGNVPSGAECPNYVGGWYYDDPSTPTKILVCPQTCSGIQAGGIDSQVDVLFGCATQEASIR